MPSVLALQSTYGKPEPAASRHEEDKHGAEKCCKLGGLNVTHSFIVSMPAGSVLNNAEFVLFMKKM